jgi:hypothetical protein
MSKKTKTSSTQTTTPSNPTWVTEGAQNLNTTIQGLGAKDPQSYIAGADPLQTMAAGNAAKLGSSPMYGQAADIFGKVAGAGANGYQAQNASAASLLDGLQNYMSPYTNDVVNTTLAGFDQNAGQQRAQAALDEARTGAFGGSGAAITRSMLGDNLARTRAATEAGLRDQAFNVGSGLSAQDAGFRQQANIANAGFQNQAAQYNAGAQDNMLARQLQAAGGLAGLGSQQGQDDRANVALQGDLGAQLRQIAQAQAGAPISLAQTQSGMFGSLPLNLFNGNTTTGSSTSKTSDPMGSLATLAALAAAPFTGGATLAGLLGPAAAGATAGIGSTLASGLTSALTSPIGGAALFSDVRLKRNVETVGYDPKGRRVVDFEYIWSPQVHRGYVAQELLATDPHAVHMDDSGFLKVNYGALA